MTRRMTDWPDKADYFTPIRGEHLSVRDTIDHLERAIYYAMDEMPTELQRPALARLLRYVRRSIRCNTNERSAS